MEDMDTVTMRDLRNRGGEVIDRVQGGEALLVTRDGRPVAELRPVRPAGVPTAALLERWHRLPSVDPVQFRKDIDALIDPRL
jgi:prevent-host-death family protein